MADRALYILMPCMHIPDFVSYQLPLNSLCSKHNWFFYPSLNISSFLPFCVCRMMFSLLTVPLPQISTYTSFSLYSNLFFDVTLWNRTSLITLFNYNTSITIFFIPLLGLVLSLKNYLIFINICIIYFFVSIFVV